MYQLIITEKPNASKRVAEALCEGKLVKKSFKKAPYYELKRNGKNIIVGCAVGHLFGLAEKKKSKGFAYPVFDIEWVPAYEQSKSSAFTKQYLEALKKLAKGADEVIVATDYDVEGEVIGLNVVRFACNRKDANRMKFSTLTKDDLIEAYNSRSESIDWGQANAGETRHFLDFYYGINLSRALTKAIKQAGMFKILSTGRVQGPALKIVCERERQIMDFKPTPFWQIILVASSGKNSIEALHEEDKFWEKDKADAVIDKTKDAKNAQVAKIDRRQFKQAPPTPFDLTSLQTESYRCFGISPKQTLELAQELYTAGIISYPRTSSQQLTEKIGFAKILKKLSSQEAYSDLANMLLSKKSLKPNNGKKKDPAHPAIYPTGLKPKDLSARQAKVYDLIVKRFLATFADPAVRETLTLSLDVSDEIFTTKGTRTISANWHVYYAPYVKLEEVEFPDLNEGDVLNVDSITLKEDETKPPKRFTPASLIKMLEKKGLGTKATRAEIVETLRRRNYVRGDSITATDLGLQTVQILEKYAPKILDEELTRHFEDDMESIREGKKTPEKVLEEARDVLTRILDEFKSKEAAIGEELKKTYTETRAELTTVGNCPSCKEGQLILRRGKYGRFIACDKYPDCSTTIKLPAGGLVEVTPKTCEECGYPVVKMIRKARRPQEVCVNLDCKTKGIPEDIGEQQCEKCKEGKMVLRKSIYGGFFACNRFPKCRNIARIASKSAPAKKVKKKSKSKTKSS
ncbi:DNA topoisomerase I [Candidatus Woesearchaeota archaeon]|nr:MAG: DNA topoisomerase I [Candidatus Woesearchaeota archaeon]